MKSAVAEHPNAGERPFADPRYQLVRMLGHGGMADVYDALDRSRDQRVALKWLRPHPDLVKHRRNAELFELEFHTLAQLAHPRVVEVYDFGIDPGGPFYTMELLEGGDLHRLAPLHWRDACAIARDVCSALSLLHSRRFVHRDISPRNVRRTETGDAKLIDFGALAPMGPNKLLVGTPPCCAPESLYLQSLDGRTDLYSLGATLYYLLVGNHAFAARSFSELHDAWRQPFPGPSAFVRDLPPALDALVLELLRLEPDARPASAAEVAERLFAIDGTAPREELQMARAYLATPVLVGRDAEIHRVARRLKRIAAGQGRSVLVEGPAGVGRSRFLDAIVLDATLFGLATVRADAEDGRAGDYGVAAALARRLLYLLPDLAREAAQPFAAALHPLVPELAPGHEPDPAADRGSPGARAQLSSALMAWFKAVAAARPLALAIDDFHLADEASAALFALLASEIEGLRLGVLASVETGMKPTAPAALEYLRESSTRLPISNLSAVESERLLRSLFGDLPQLPLLAHRAHALSGGNPRDLMRIAQHLIDSGALRFATGAWSMTTELNQLALPESMAQALQARVAALPEPARVLAWSLALCPDQTFAPGECATLCDAPDAAGLLTALEALTHAELVRHASGSIGLAHSSWMPLLSEMLPSERAASLHDRLARVFLQRGDQFRAGSQWLQGGQTARALDLLVSFAEEAIMMSARTDALRSQVSMYRTPPPDWRQTYVGAIRACDELGRPPRHKFLLLSRMIAVCSLYDIHDREHAGVLLAILGRTSGLDDYAELADVPPGERLKLALQRVSERHQNTPEAERVLDPLAAIRELARANGSALSMLTRALDLEALRTLPDLTPLTALSPSLRVIAMLADALAARLSGRLSQARRIYEELLELLLAPDHAGLETTAWEFMRHMVNNVLAMIEASRGDARCLERARELSENPAFEVNGVVARMLYALFQGNAAEADGYRDQIERLRIQSGSRQMFEGAHLIWELDAHAMADDLTRLRSAIDQLTPLAAKFPGWIPVLRCARAERERIWGSPQKTLSAIRLVLASAKPGEHQIWTSAAACELRAQIDLGQYDEALARADTHVASARTALDEVPPVLELLRALALACSGKASAADDPGVLADRITAGLIAQGVSGLIIGYAHELRARIALARGDREGADRSAAECRAIYGAHGSPALRAKLERLRDAARSGGASAVLRSSRASEAISTLGHSRIGELLQTCRDPSQRARLALSLVLHHAGARAGLLFERTPSGLVCAASIGGITPTPDLVDRAQAYLEAEGDGEITTSTDSELGPDRTNEWSDASGQTYRPVLLMHNSEGRTVITGLVVVALATGGEFVYPASAASEISRYTAAVSDSTLLP